MASAAVPALAELAAAAAVTSTRERCSSRGVAWLQIFQPSVMAASDLANAMLLVSPLCP